jgi:hypothetical protein
MKAALYFPHRLGRLKPRASTSSGSLAKAYNIFCHCSFFNLSISLLLWKDTINTEINASVDLLALLFFNGVPGKLQKDYGSLSSASLIIVQNTLLSSSIHKVGDWEGPRK